MNSFCAFVISRMHWMSSSKSFRWSAAALLARSISSANPFASSRTPLIESASCMSLSARSSSEAPLKASARPLTADRTPVTARPIAPIIIGPVLKPPSFAAACATCSPSAWKFPESAFVMAANRPLLSLACFCASWFAFLAACSCRMRFASAESVASPVLSCAVIS